MILSKFRIALAFLTSKLIDIDTKRGFNRLFNKAIKIAAVCQGMYINNGVHLLTFYFWDFTGEELYV